MTEEEIRQGVFGIVAKEASLDKASLTLDTRLGDLRIKSLAMVQILFEIEEGFGIYIPQDALDFRIATLGDVCDGVNKLIVARQESA